MLHPPLYSIILSIDCTKLAFWLKSFKNIATIRHTVGFVCFLRFVIALNTFDSVGQHCCISSSKFSQEQLVIDFTLASVKLLRHSVLFIYFNSIAIFLPTSLAMLEFADVAIRALPHDLGRVITAMTAAFTCPLIGYLRLDDGYLTNIYIAQQCCIYVLHDA